MGNLAIFLKFNDEPEFQLPVNPETIKVSTGRGYEDVELTQLGETTFFGNEKLREYTFSSFFPSTYNLSYTEYAEGNDSKTPWEIVQLIEKWMSSRQPIRLTVSLKEPKAVMINVPVTIRSFNYEERAGHVGDLFYDLTLKEYRFIEFQRLVKQNDDGTVSVSEESNRPGDREAPEAYEVQPGDTLWHIAQRTLGAGDQWRSLYALNQDVIGPNPNLIFPGQVLVIRE